MTELAEIKGRTPVNLTLAEWDELKAICERSFNEFRNWWWSVEQARGWQKGPGDYTDPK